MKIGNNRINVKSRDNCSRTVIIKIDTKNIDIVTNNGEMNGNTNTGKGWSGNGTSRQGGIGDGKSVPIGSDTNGMNGSDKKISDTSGKCKDVRGKMNANGVSGNGWSKSDTHKECRILKLQWGLQ